MDDFAPIFLNMAQNSNSTPQFYKEVAASFSFKIPDYVTFELLLRPNNYN